MPLLPLVASLVLLGTPQDRPRFVVLAVGVKNYPNATQSGFGPLNGPNDASAFIGALKQFYGFDRAKGDEAQILVQDADTTRAKIWNGLKWLVSTAKRGDAVVFFYSGHGTRVPDPSKASGFSQAIVPIDVRRTTGRYDGPIDRQTLIAGPDFRSILGEMEAKGLDNVTMVFDSCHSESISRGSLRPKSGVPNGDIAKPQGHLLESKPTQFDDSVNVISAAKMDMEAFEDTDSKRGVLTTAMIQTMELFARRGASELSYDAFMDQVRARVQFKANAMNTVQIPQLQGPGTRLLFGTKTVEQSPYYRVRVTGAVPHLEAGEVLGVREGFVFGIYTDGKPMAGQPDHYARATLPIGVDSARLEITDETGKPRSVLPKELIGARAKLLDGQPNGKVRLYVEGKPSAPFLQQVYALKPTERGSADRYDLRLAQPGTKWVLTNSRGVVLKTLEGADEASIVKGLAPEIVKEAKRRTVLELAPSGPAAAQVELELVQVRSKWASYGEVVESIVGGLTSGSPSLSLKTQPAQATNSMDQRFALRARIVPGTKPAYAPHLCVLDVTANGRVSQLWPIVPPGASEPSQDRQLFMLNPSGDWYWLGSQNQLIPASPQPSSDELKNVACFAVDGEHDGRGVETLKGIATKGYQSFSVLFVEGAQQGVARGPAHTALDKLLASIADAEPLPFATRAGTTNVAPSSWSVAMVHLLVDVDPK